MSKRKYSEVEMIVAPKQMEAGRSATSWASPSYDLVRGARGQLKC